MPNKATMGKSGSKVKTGGKAAAAIGIVTMLASYITPEMIEKTVSWLKDQRFSDKFVELFKMISQSKDNNPLKKIGYQCDAVEEAIETKSAEFPDDAPVAQWHQELAKIRRGVALISKGTQPDRRKTRLLQQRSKKLFNSVFAAAIN